MKRLLGIVLVAALTLGGVGYLLMSDSGGDTYTVTAEVEQAPNLFAGGDVRVRGVEVGKIISLEPGAASVVLTLEVQRGIKIPADADLLVVPITVIADRYVQFVPAYSNGPTLEDGDHLSLARTEIPAELDDVLTQLKGLLGALEPRSNEKQGPLARLVEDFDEAFAGKSKDIAAALEGSASVLENLADSRNSITGLIQHLDRLFVAFADRASEIGILNERLDLVTQVLLADQDDLEGTIENLAAFSEEAAGVLADSGDDLGRSFGRLGTVLKGILKHQGALLEGTRWTNVIAQALGETDSTGKGLYAYSGRQAAPGTAGAEYNYRLDTRDTIACERINALIESFLGLNPGATIQQLRDTLMAFFPETYKDDLAYLVDLLIPLCADLPGARLGDRATQLIDELAAELGPENLGTLLVRWFIGEEST